MSPGGTSTSAETWADQNHQAAHELGNWARENVRVMRHLSAWEKQDPARAHEICLWSVHSAEPPEGYLNAHARDRIVDELVREHRSPTEAFMMWCRHHPAEAEVLMKDPHGLQWVGGHLYRL